MGKFVINPSNLTMTAKLLRLNNAGKFEGLTQEQSELLLTELIELCYKRYVVVEGAEHVCNSKSIWNCWKGVCCSFGPAGAEVGHKELFYDDDSAGQDLITVVLHTVLDKSSAAAFVDQ